MLLDTNHGIYLHNYLGELYIWRDRRSPLEPRIFLMRISNRYQKGFEARFFNLKVCAGLSSGLCEREQAERNAEFEAEVEAELNAEREAEDKAKAEAKAA